MRLFILVSNVSGKLTIEDTGMEYANVTAFKLEARKSEFRKEHVNDVLFFGGSFYGYLPLADTQLIQIKDLDNWHKATEALKAL